jgi:hypothetical protein
MLKKILLSAVMGLAVISSSSVPAAAQDPDIYWYRTTWFTDSSQSTYAGYMDGWCSGKTEMHGQQTPWYSRRYFATCP